MIINETMARRFFGDADPVGRRFKAGRWTVEIVGVAEHVQMRSLRDPGLPQMWVTYGSIQYSDLNIVVTIDNFMPVRPRGVKPPPDDPLCRWK